jgi:glycosyltransferase involved in cell wall biosynthesis
MKKTILIITDNLPNQINGVVTTFNNLKLVGEQEEFTFEFITPLDFKHINMPKYPEVKLSFPFGLTKKIKKINPDFIHIATEGTIGIAAKLACKKNKWKYNTSYHTNFPEFAKKIYGMPEKITYKFLRWFHNRSYKVLTTTNTMVQELKSNGFKCDVISWTRGINREELTPTKPKENREQIILLSVGRVSKEKNLDVLCQLSTNPQYHIQIVGDGPYRKKLEKKYPLVEFVGYKSGSELADYYVNADVFCFPSKTDTFGIVMIEAMSLGCPVAGYPVAGPIDVIESDVNGYMDENFENAILKCLSLDRHKVYVSSFKWTWENCWKIFKENLVHK